MTAYAKNASGVWAPSHPFADSAGVWKTVKEAYAKDSGIWKPTLNYANMLLLQGEGVNGSQVFADTSPQGNPQTVYGNVQISTAAAKFGTGSILFDGTGDALYCENAGFDLAGPFTMEGWFNIVARGGVFQVPLFDLRPPTGGDGIRVSIDNNENLAFYQNENIRASSSTLAAGTWYHVALTKDASNVYRAFRNGVQFGSNYTDATVYASGACCLGQYVDARSDAARVSYQGYMDEVRFTKGIARYTANFTPPTASFEPFA